MLRELQGYSEGLEMWRRPLPDFSMLEVGAASGAVPRVGDSGSGLMSGHDVVRVLRWRPTGLWALGWGAPGWDTLLVAGQLRKTVG